MMSFQGRVQEGKVLQQKKVEALKHEYKQTQETTSQISV